jgi:hypothetical protein
MKKLEFTVKLEGKEGRSVAWLNAPFDVVKVFGTRARVPMRGRPLADFSFGAFASLTHAVCAPNLRSNGSTSYARSKSICPSGH